MRTNTINFTIDGKEVYVHGYPELEGCCGILDGDGMAFFFGKGYELHIADTATGKIRKLTTESGCLLVDDSNIDYRAIEKECCHGIQNAQRKIARFAKINRWDGFKEGLCAISWMLYPDGRYFADSDGFGMEENDEEKVYAIMDTGLEIIEPFRPIKDIRAYLDETRKNRSKKTADKKRLL